jgi:hypothetical protein
MTLTDLWFVALGLAAIAIWVFGWRWKQRLDRCDVTTHERPVTRDPQADFHRTVGSLHGPASKGFDAQQGDRRAHVQALQRRRGH